MENRNALIAIALSAIVSSACTAAAIKFSTNDPSGAQDLNSVRDIQSQIEELENNLALESQARQSLQQQVANYQLSVKQGKNILEPDSNEQIVSQQAQTAPIQPATGLPKKPVNRSGLCCRRSGTYCSNRI